MDVEVVPELRPLGHHGRLHAGQVDQRRNLETRSRDDLRRGHLSKTKAAEKRQLNGAAAIHRCRQCIGSRLPKHGPFQIGNILEERGRLEGRASKKIKIDGLAVPQPQRNRGPSVQGKSGRCFGQFRPQAPLGNRQDIKAGTEGNRHSSL